MDSFSSNFINFAYANNVFINTSVVRYAWNSKGGEGWVSGGFDVRGIGLRANRGYEQTGYLSNERVVIRDRRVPISTDGSTVAYYKPLVESVHDYYPFGWEKQLTTVNPYPFNYQGQLFDGDLGWQYYRYRNYDPMVARFWRVEPLIDSLPMWSGYGYMKGMVTYGIEEEGLWVLMIGFGGEGGKILGGGEFGALIEGDWSGATGNTFVTWTEVWDIDDIKSVINEIDNYLSKMVVN